jgi:hypothetical protein
MLLERKAQSQTCFHLFNPCRFWTSFNTAGENPQRSRRSAFVFPLAGSFQHLVKKHGFDSSVMEEPGIEGSQPSPNSFVSYHLRFHAITYSFAQRQANKSNTLSHLRTLSIATGVVPPRSA